MRSAIELYSNSASDLRVLCAVVTLIKAKRACTTMHRNFLSLRRSRSTMHMHTGLLDEWTNIMYYTIVCIFEYSVEGRSGVRAVDNALESSVEEDDDTGM